MQDYYVIKDSYIDGLSDMDKTQLSKLPIRKSLDDPSTLSLCKGTNLASVPTTVVNAAVACIVVDNKYACPDSDVVRFTHFELTDPTYGYIVDNPLWEPGEE